MRSMDRVSRISGRLLEIIRIVRWFLHVIINLFILYEICMYMLVYMISIYEAQNMYRRSSWFYFCNFLGQFWDSFEQILHKSIIWVLVDRLIRSIIYGYDTFRILHASKMLHSPTNTNRKIQIWSNYFPSLANLHLIRTITSINSSPRSTNCSITKCIS